MKDLADNKIYVRDSKIELCLGRVENIVGKGENAGFHNVFPQCFQKAFFLRVIKSWDCVEVSTMIRLHWLTRVGTLHNSPKVPFRVMGHISFSTMFSKSFFPRAVKSRNCMIMS